MLKESYNGAGSLRKETAAASAAPQGENGARIENCYNTGRINLKDGGKNDPGDDIPLANGMIGGVAAAIRRTGSLRTAMRSTISAITSGRKTLLRAVSSDATKQRTLILSPTAVLFPVKT